MFKQDTEEADGAFRADSSKGNERRVTERHDPGSRYASLPESPP